MSLAAVSMHCDNWHMDENTTGRRVLALRKRLGLSQELLGERGGLNRDVVVKIETGKNKLTSHDAREKLSRGLGITVVALDAYLSGHADIETTAASAAHDASRSQAPTPAPPPSRKGTSAAAFDVAVGRAFKSGAYELDDLDAVRALLREGAAMLDDLPGHDEAAHAWLRAAARLRALGRPVTFATLSWALAASPEAQSDALNAEARAELAALGGVPPEVPVQIPPPRR